jgi:hypothetical protein
VDPQDELAELSKTPTNREFAVANEICSFIDYEASRFSRSSHA